MGLARAAPDAVRAGDADQGADAEGNGQPAGHDPQPALRRRLDRPARFPGAGGENFQGDARGIVKIKSLVAEIAERKIKSAR